MRAPTPADAPAVAALIAACQAADGDPPTMTADELLGDWAGLDLDEESVLIVSPTGEVAAGADMVHRRYVQGSVYANIHPDHRGRGLGSALVRWGGDWLRARWDRAPRGARVIAQHYIRSTRRPRPPIRRQAPPCAPSSPAGTSAPRSTPWKTPSSIAGSTYPVILTNGWR